MTAQNTQAVRRILVAVPVGLGLLMLPALYPLSAGPATWLVDHGWMDGWTYVSVYRPLMSFAYDHPLFNDLMNTYVGWWGGPINL